MGEAAAADVGADAADLGLLTSAYFIAFAIAQLPIGLALDRYGPRRSEAALLLIAAAGAVLYALAGSIGELALARAAMGVGFAASLMAAFTANRLFFNADRLAVMNALTMVAGGLGALAASTPLAALAGSVGWRGGYGAIAIFALAAAGAIFFIGPKLHGRGRAPSSPGEALGGLRAVLSAPHFWRIAPASAVMQGILLAYLSLWIGPFLRAVDGFDPDAAAEALALCAIATIVGYLLTAAAAHFEAKRGRGPMRICAAGLTGMTATLVALGADWGTSLLLWIAFSVFGAASITSYAGVSAALAPALAGRANTAVNLLVFLFAFAAQAGIGALVRGDQTIGDADAHRRAALIVAGICFAGLFPLWRGALRDDDPVQPPAARA